MSALLLATSLTLGAHLYTLHTRPGFESATVGLYAKTADGFTVGGFRNSYGRASFYGGYTLETSGRRFALTVGAVTGYPAARVMPLLVPSVRMPIDSRTALRFSVLPKPPQHGSCAALHLSVEHDF